MPLWCSKLSWLSWDQKEDCDCGTFLGFKAKEIRALVTEIVISNLFLLGESDSCCILLSP